MTESIYIISIYCIVIAAYISIVYAQLYRVVFYCITGTTICCLAIYSLYYTVVDPSLTPILPELFVSTLRFAQSVRYFYPFSVKLTNSWHLHMHYRIFCVANKDSINLVHICGHIHTSVNLWLRNKR